MINQGVNKMENGNGEVYIEKIGKLLQDTDNISFEIRRLEDDNRKATMDNMSKIRDWQKKLKSTIDIIREELLNSKKDKIMTYCGWVHFRDLPDMLVLIKGTLEEIEEKYPETANSYIKTTKTLKKSTIKKALEDGVIELTGATTKPQDKKFEYKYTGIK